jgi:uncharacterized membrane protein
MSASNDSAADPVIFCAMITPHRSLSRAGFLILMALIGGTSFVAGAVFLVAGAWPVMGFFGLDALLIYWAFHASYRAAAAYEVVTMTASELKVRKVSHLGRSAEWSMNPVWTQLDRMTHAEFGIQQLFLVSRGRRLAIANFLCPGEKESFAAALATALGEAKRGPTRTVIP